MVNDMDLVPNKVNWASLVLNLLMFLGFNEVWLEQGVGNYNIFISLLKQRLTDTLARKIRYFHTCKFL